MNQNFPVYTTTNECQDCYKCVRHCHCKAIQIVNARAAIIPELCVSCGECVKVCPAHAKKIRSDLPRARFMLENGEKVYASIAPSYIGYFKGISIGQLSAALLKLGFAGCSETALGAEQVSAETGEFLKNAEPGVYISSACPSSVDYICKYHSEWANRIVPILSPVMAHSRLLHKEYGNGAKVVFIGPCAAKKNEADRNPEDLALALTFKALEDWLMDEEIDLKSMPDAPLVPHPAEEGRSYSIEGGMNDTIRERCDDIRYIAVSGLANIGRLLNQVNQDDFRASGIRLFIEVLACENGCVNGPVMPKDGAGIDVVLRTALTTPAKTSLGRKVEVPIRQAITTPPVQPKPVNEQDIINALQSVGKFTAEDELNCGGCGYNTCREFAHAMLEGKAETSMCLSYLRKISQKTSNALIKYIPVAVVIADQKLQILECNRNFAALCGEDSLAAYDSCGNLNGAFLASMVEFPELFDIVLSNGGEVERMNQMYGNRIYNINVFTITPGQTVGAVIQDVTQSELKREQVAEKAREVIRKNVMTVQKIARYLGEHMADTEILLKEVAGTYSDHKNPEETGKTEK